jgi:HD superfamily phosphodiesterase
MANLPVEQLEQLKNTALLHDIGKIGVREDGNIQMNSWSEHSGAGSS